MGRIIVMPEAWVKRVATFVTSGVGEEQARAEARPAVLFSRTDPIAVQGNYSDYNVRSRHFRCLETFFVEVDDAGEIQAVVALEGLIHGKRTLLVYMVVALLPSEVGTGERLRGLLAGVQAKAAEFVPVGKLRITYLYDHSFAAPVQAQVAKLITDAPDEAGLIEEARVPNETGPGREAVLLSWRTAGGAAA